MTTKPLLDRLLSLINELTDGNKKRFAETLGIKPENVNRWINEGSLPSAEHLSNLKNKLNININWLLTGEGEKFIKSRVGYAHQKEQPSMVRKALEEYGYDKEERAYIDKLIKILRTKQDKTVLAIKQNIDAFLDNPDKAKEPVKKTKAG